MNQLQMIYTMQLLDALKQYQNFSILDEVTEVKRKEQIMQGKTKIEHMGITSVDQIFQYLNETFGCAKWEVDLGNNFASTKTCMLQAIAKKMNLPSPCKLFCLDPIEGLLNGIDENIKVTVQKTLWDKDECRLYLKD